MKSRLAVTMMLALGLLMSGTGATLAVSGLSSSGSAAEVQYPDNDTSNTNDTGNMNNTDDTGPSANVLGDGDSSPVTPTGTNEVQPTRQVSSTDSDTLPFTGFLAIPVLLGGVALLGTGAVLRRRSRDDGDVS